MGADSTAMTIDFLRARLLSERSVSRASRERADQLSKRVEELEEQLRIVTTQRKNAEKAANEVLSILESQGFGYLTEPELIDSSSDQDEETEIISPVTEQCNETNKLKESAELADELANETPPAGSLSWKGRCKSPDSLKKNNNKLRQRQRRAFYFTSPDPSPKYQIGKSCRKIKPRSGADQEERENSKCSTDSNNESKNEENGEIFEERKEEMERALEEQANLIGQFEEQENLQREWEKMYNETRNTSVVESESESKEPTDENSCEDKNEIVENTESKNQECTDENSCEDKTEIAENIESENTECTDENTECKNENNCEYEKQIEDQESEKSEKSENSKWSEEPKFNPEILSSNGSITEKYDHEISDTSYDKAIVAVSNVQINDEKTIVAVSNVQNQDEKAIVVVSNVQIHDDSNESNDSYSNHEDQNPLALQLYEPPVDKVKDVLESLRLAKISLRGNLSKKRPVLHKTQEILAITQHGEQNTDTNTDTQHIVNIPVGDSAGLFRLPTDSFPSSYLSESESVLSLEYSKDLMSRFSNEDYFESRNAQLALHDSFSTNSSGNWY